MQIPESSIVAVELAYEFVSTDPYAVNHLANPLFRVLATIRSEGSIAAAARTLGCSYRHLWGYLKQQEARLDHPLVDWNKGQAARLSAFAEKLLWAEASIRARLAPQIENLASEIGRELTLAFNDQIVIAEVAVGHDLALPRLRALCRQAGLLIDLHFTDSLSALAALRRAPGRFAGIDLPVGQDALLRRQGPLHQALGRWLRPGREVLIRVARRTQGIMTAQGNPLGIRGLDDLPRVRFVNRPQGSTLRLLFDHLLNERSVALPNANAQPIEATHLAVATRVASGGADAGFGSQAAARQLGLDFVPVLEEDCFLACPAQAIDSPAATRLRNTLAGPGWQAVLAGLPGQSADGAGEVLTLRQAVPWYERAPRAKKNRTSVS